MNIRKKIRNRADLFLRRTFSGYIRSHNCADFPDLISFQTNSFCNSRCIGCPHPLVKHTVSQGHMSEELFRKIIDECKKYPVKLVLPFFMNEPFTDKRIVDRVDYIKRHLPGVTVKLNSNGALITREIAHRLVESKLDQLTLGVQGIDREDFEKYMVGLDYLQTMENVRYLAGLKRNFVVDVNILPFKGIRSKIDATIKFWSDLGFIPWLTEPWDSAGVIDTKEIGKIAVRKSVKGCYNIDSPFFSQQPLHIINILFNGDVVGCCMDWHRKYFAGNIAERSMYEVWHSPAFDAFRDRVYGLVKSGDDFICRKCNISI